MTTTTIKFDRETTYTGRNGQGRQTGTRLELGPTGEDNYVEIFPINSKGNIANCSICIPIEHVTAFANALLQFSDPE